MPRIAKALPRLALIVLAASCSQGVTPRGTAAQTPIPVANGRALTDSEVGVAIALGKAGDGPFGFGRMSGTTLRVTAFGPIGTIAAMSAKARQEYLAFTPESVPPDARAPIIRVIASPHPQIIGSDLLNPDVLRVVIQGRLPDQRDSIVQPLSSATVPRTWTNAFGASYETHDVRATFNTSVLALQDLVLIVVTKDGEARFKVKPDERSQLR